jgi:SNF2 family DNA or RNA helicase
MHNDFDKERKLKKKYANDLSKLCKKSLETRHLEVEKTIKKQEQELKKKCLFISRSVNNYWKKIEKITKHHYNVLLQENKVLQQQNRLLAFINKLQKISTRVADSLPSGKIIVDEIPANTEEISIILKKNEDNTYSIIDNNIDENIVAKVAQCAEQFQPKGINLSQVKIDTSTPFLLKGELREYQLIGLHWLTALHDNRINGILADEMGLGKTIQTISLIAHLAGNKGIWGPHLIVVPTTIIINWEIEFKKWCPSLKILSYYGNQKERKAKRYVYILNLGLAQTQCF